MPLTNWFWFCPAGLSLYNTIWSTVPRLSTSSRKVQRAVAISDAHLPLMPEIAMSVACPKLIHSQIVTGQFAEVVSVSNICVRKSYDLEKRAL